MRVENLKDLYCDFETNGVILSYQGPFRQDLIEEITMVVSKRIARFLHINHKGKYISLYIELAQNIHRYSAARESKRDGSEVSHGIILAGTKGSTTYILTGNPVSADQKRFLTQKLEHLQNCSPLELKKMYKEQLRNYHPLQRSKGARLGLIDVFRRSDTVEYYFTPLKSGGYFYSIKAEFQS